MINSYKLSEIAVGLKCSFDLEVTTEMMTMFKTITGDVNPLHMDETFAVDYGYQDKVVYGMLVSSFYSTLIGVHLPGKFAIFQSADISFVSPVFIGDKLSVTGEVTFVHSVYKQIEIKAIIINQKGKKVSRAKLKTGIHE